MSKLWLIFCWHQPKIQKMIHFWHFNDHNLGSKHDNLTNDPIFSTCSLSSIRWYISFLHFKTFKIQFYGSLPSLPKMTLSSLLTRTSFFYKKFCNFRYITCFVPNLILIWSHGLINLKKVLEHFLPSTSYLILAPSLEPFACLFSNW